jgi:hypothetical protein
VLRLASSVVVVVVGVEVGDEDGREVVAGVEARRQLHRERPPHKPAI